MNTEEIEKRRKIYTELYNEVKSRDYTNSTS